MKYTIKEWFYNKNQDVKTKVERSIADAEEAREVYDNTLLEAQKGLDDGSHSTQILMLQATNDEVYVAEEKIAGFLEGFVFLKDGKKVYATFLCQCQVEEED